MRRSIEFELKSLNKAPWAAPWRETQTVAAWLRHACGEALRQQEISEEWIDSYVLGHTAVEDYGHRLSFAPVASIGYAHSDAGIRRALIVEPPTATAADEEALGLLEIKLSGWPLTDRGGKARAVLAPLGDKSKVMPFYKRQARIWESVTPVVLHGYNSARGRISLNKTDRLLRQAFEAAGFAESLTAEITFQCAPLWAGTEGASAIRVPLHLAKWPRVHVRVEFRDGVEGPVLAGIGRHYGIGVFAARASG